jgi:uncharacterized protein
MTDAVTANREAPAAGGRVRVLGKSDLGHAVRLLSKSPVENVFVASRVRSSGIEPASLGCPIWGYEQSGKLVSLCHAGYNLVPVNADRAAIAAYANFAGPQRMCTSILGPAAPVLDLYAQLAELYGSSWSEVREVRPHQPVMAIESEPAIPPDPRVRRVTLLHWEPYFDAAVRMFTEEVGVSPLQGSPAGYRFYIRQLITSGRAFAILSGDRVLFKADLGSVSGTVSQVQGVWVDPEFRGQGIAVPAMAAVVRMARSVAPVVSLYVNDYNEPAKATYRRVGFRTVGEFATVLY